MKYRYLGNSGLLVSRLCLGTMTYGMKDWGCDLDTARKITGKFIEAGGNFIDTADMYSTGVSEEMLGIAIRDHDRDNLVIATKCWFRMKETPNAKGLSRKHIFEAIDASLRRLGTDYIDLYLLHRDDPTVPVGPIVEALNEHRSAGRIRAFGGSNWTAARIAEANAYAEKAGKRGFAAVSNNFSLARMIDPVWPGCIAASNLEYRQYLEQTQLCLMPWSSQARGFFTGRAYPEDLSDDQLVRCWYSNGNFKRLERARKLASKRGVLPINVALAFVLCQPFPTHPLIGPRTLAEASRTTPLPRDFASCSGERSLWPGWRPRP